MAPNMFPNKVYDQQGNLLESYDITLGWLKDDVRIVHHPAVEGVEEKYHYNTLREYPNGGKSLEKIIDVPGVEACEAWDEEIPILVFVPYTQEELDAIEAEKNKKTPEQRIEELENENTLLQARIKALTERGEFVEDCLAEMAMMVYAG